MSLPETSLISPAPTFWGSIREALRGSQQDFTTGSLHRAIVLLAIPMVLEMVLESLFAVVDVFWVGRLGADAMATVGITESLLSLVFAVGFGLGLSTTAMVARRIGEKDPTGAAVAGVQAIVIGIATSLAIGVPCGFYAPRLLEIMGASPQIVAVGSGYARVALGGCGAVLLLFLNNAIFRGAGDAAVAMRLLWVSNILNLILDPCFIFGWGPFPKLGITGAATATLIGRSIGVAYQFYRLLHGTERIHILASQLRVNLGVLLRLLRVSLTGILQFAIADVSWVGLVRIVSLFGSAALAGYTIAIRIVIFVLLFVSYSEQRRGNASGSESRRKATGTRGTIRLANRPIQHDFSWDGRHFLHYLCGADCSLVHQRSGGSSHCCFVPTHPELRKHWLRLRSRNAAVAFANGRGGHAETPTIVTFLVSGC